MKITFLGHAGFYVESEHSVILMDPWVSRYGAFDSAWFQYPKNSHMLDYLLKHFEETLKDKYIYISHEHKDHFDIEFLKLLKNRNFKFILANFHRPLVKEKLQDIDYKCEDIVLLNYEEEFKLKDGDLRLFILDAALDCDSAILLRTDQQNFLNINDCKLHEKLEKIVEQYGSIDVFAAQFSGAIWHPVCYEMPVKEYQRVSIRKKMSKFLTVSKAIRMLNPSVYIPSAGPPCFLDPMLMPVNFEKINIFPRAAAFRRYLDNHCKEVDTLWPEMMPGDTLDVDALRVTELATERTGDSDFESYINAYSQEYHEYFQQREIENRQISPQQVFSELRNNLQQKMNNLNLDHLEANTILYWRISDYAEMMYRIDLTAKTITTTRQNLDPENYWMVESPAWQVNKVLTNEMSWPDFVLSFRVKLSRNPDIYDIVTHGFIALDACEIERFCKLTKKFHANTKERTVVECDGKKYSIIRWCPHMGGDLSAGWLEDGCWVCPRHQWHFDLANQGRCVTSTDTIDAVCLDDDKLT